MCWFWSHKWENKGLVAVYETNVTREELKNVLPVYHEVRLQCQKCGTIKLKRW